MGIAILGKGVSILGKVYNSQFRYLLHSDFLTSSVGFDLQIFMWSISACNYDSVKAQNAAWFYLSSLYLVSPVESLLLDIFFVNFATLVM